MTSWLNPNAKALVRGGDDDPYGVAASQPTDTERLDWLTAQSSVVMAAEDGTRDCVLHHLPVDAKDPSPASVEANGEGWQSNRGANPREAIDAAMRGR